MNNLLIRRFSTIALISTGFSFVMLVNGCIKFIYYKHCVKNKTDIAEIPLGMKIHIKSSWLIHIDWKIVEIQLVPGTKVLNCAQSLATNTDATPRTPGPPEDTVDIEMVQPSVEYAQAYPNNYQRVTSHEDIPVAQAVAVRGGHSTRLGVN